MKFIANVLKKYTKGFIVSIDKIRKFYDPEMTISNSTKYIEDLSKKFEKEYDEKIK